MNGQGELATMNTQDKPYKILKCFRALMTWIMFAIMFSTTAFVSYKIGLEQQNTKQQEIPTIRNMQRILGCEKIDGRLGPCWRDSETQTKWEEKIIQQHIERR